VGFLGGFDPSKGVGDVVHAVQRANRDVGRTRVLLCGRPPQRGQAAARVASGAGDLGTLLHDLGETERVEEVLTAADVVVMATHRRLGEALPATLSEAMACGTPVLAYASGGMAEVIGADAVAGRLARPDDRDDLARVLTDMLRDAPGRLRLATAALARAGELFDPRRAAERYEEVLSGGAR
jgi:glycosyltransferase involved in cell wall biosynthesis